MLLYVKCYCMLYAFSYGGRYTGFLSGLKSTYRISTGKLHKTVTANACYFTKEKLNIINSQHGKMITHSVYIILYCYNCVLSNFVF